MQRTVFGIREKRHNASWDCKKKKNLQHIELRLNGKNRMNCRSMQTELIIETRINKNDKETFLDSGMLPGFDMNVQYR